MTVGTQMQQAIATVQSAAATMKTFSLETQDKEAQKMFGELAQTFDGALNQLKGRQQYIQNEEVQYR